MQETVMTTVQVPDEIVERYEDLARAEGREKDALIREALITQLEDLEDARIVSERLANPGRRISLEEVEKNLGLED
jgi:RHH-type rel operon transcriptional repressor/antitoxin RelB